MIETPFLITPAQPKPVPSFDNLFRRASVPGINAKAQALVKTYGDQLVLKGLDLTIPAGQFVAIVGRSGCGKSTFLRLLAGLEPPTSGQIHFGEQAQSPADFVRIMFQEPRLLPWANVLENVGVGLSHMRGLLNPDLRAAQVLEQVGLADRAKDWPSVLSGGQKQRVALARALVSQPRLLALDEPLGALDALTRLEMQSLLEQVWLRQKFTAVLVTHDVTEALMLADRVVLIEEGSIALDLAVDLPRPRNRALVEFVNLEQHILRNLLKSDHIAPEYAI